MGLIIINIMITYNMMGLFFPHGRENVNVEGKSESSNILLLHIEEESVAYDLHLHD